MGKNRKLWLTPTARPRRSACSVRVRNAPRCQSAMYPAPRNPTLNELSALILPVDEIRVTTLGALPVFDQSHRSASKLCAVEFEQTDEFRELGNQARSGVRGGIHPREPAAPAADINAK